MWPRLLQSEGTILDFESGVSDTRSKNHGRLSSDSSSGCSKTKLQDDRLVAESIAQCWWQQWELQHLGSRGSDSNRSGFFTNQYSDELWGIDSGIQNSWRNSELSSIFPVNFFLGQIRQSFYKPEPALLQDVSIVLYSLQQFNLGSLISLHNLIWAKFDLWLIWGYKKKVFGERALHKFGVYGYSWDWRLPTLFLFFPSSLVSKP